MSTLARPDLTHDEKLSVLQIVDHATALPIIAGTAGPSTDAAVRQAREFAHAGADALLVSPIPAHLSEPLDVLVAVPAPASLMITQLVQAAAQCRGRLTEVGNDGAGHVAVVGEPDHPGEGGEILLAVSQVVEDAADA
jgi:2-methylisocitrate lyase-like PEP mutase family enzyme